MAKKINDNTELVTRAATALEISSELGAVTRAIIEAGGEMSEEQHTALKEWKADLEVKGENIALVMQRMEADEAFFKQIEEQARSKRKVMENTRDRLRKYIAMCMVEANVKKLKRNDGLFSISLVDGRIKSVVDDVSALPTDFVLVREVFDPDNQKIKDALESGVEVPGAHLERGDQYIMIR